eukprot:1150565-Pelagomonas_calceolata.AAC.17
MSTTSLPTIPSKSYERKRLWQNKRILLMARPVTYPHTFKAAFEKVIRAPFWTNLQEETRPSMSKGALAMY